jgi:hypothetical protein
MLDWIDIPFPVRRALISGARNVGLTAWYY